MHPLTTCRDFHPRSLVSISTRSFNRTCPPGFISSQMMVYKIDVLPHELVEKILAELDPRDVCRCKQVCRWFNEFIRTSSVLQWQLMCLFEGVTYVGPPTASLQDRASLLRQQKNNWEKLDWKRSGTEAIEGPMNAYDHIGEIFGVLSAGEFTTLHLPSKSRPGCVRTTRTLGFPANDFVLDQTQDLVIFLTVNNTGLDGDHSLRILLNSTLEPHPEATVPQISIHNNGNQLHFMQLNQDIIGIASRHILRGTNVRIWNWKQGELLAHRLVKNCHEEGFTILTKNVYIISSRLGSGCISINSISPHKEIARLKLPELAKYASISTLTLQAAPFFANPLDGRSFETTLENRIYSLNLVYGHGRYVNWRAFLLAKTLLRYAKTDEESEEGQTSPTKGARAASSSLSYSAAPDFKEEPDGVRIVPWEEWGPDNVRMIEKLPHLEVNCFVDASRVILPLPGHKAVRVLDFNVPKMTANTDVLISDSIFKKSFTSRLPYASYRRTVPEDLRDPATVSFMLDDERVVVLRKTQDGGYDIIPFAIN